jgi:hypothetical protein
MAFHVVTNKFFLACEKVTSVVLEDTTPDPLPPRRRYRKKGSKPKPILIEDTPLVVIPQQFTITIAYYPISRNTNNAYDERELTIRIIGKKTAHLLYAEIIKEVQEQHPNEGYLDKLVNKMLENEEFQVTNPEVVVNVN